MISVGFARIRVDFPDESILVDIGRFWSILVDFGRFWSILVDFKSTKIDQNRLKSTQMLWSSEITENPCENGIIYSKHEKTS